MTADATRDPHQTHASIFLRLNDTADAPRAVAWQEFFDFYSPIIAGFARNLGASPQDVQDVIQDVMLGFYRVSPKFEYDPAKGRFRGFLKVCTFRALRARLLSNRRMLTNTLEDLEPESEEITRIWSAAWDQELLRLGLQAVRQDCQEPFRQKTFRAFELYTIFGQPADQVAKELNMEINSVYKAKERISRVLRAKIAALERTRG